MIEKAAFQSGMHALGAAFNREITEDVLRVFDGTLSPVLTDDQWQKAVRLVIEKEVYFPPPAVLLKYGTTDRPVLVDGAEVFGKILNDYISGFHCSPRQVAEQYGLAARYAFAAAGGVMAFENCGSEETAKWVRKAFLESWKDTVETNPQMALPGPANQLPTHEEAAEIVGELGRRMP
jgi:hypothetical protein